MTNARMVFKNQFDGANIVSVTSEAISVDNLQDQSPGKVWRSTSAVAQVITIDLWSNKQINCLALFNINATTSGTIRIKGGVDPTFAVNLYDQTHTLIDTGLDFDESESYAYSLIYLTASTLARHWQLTITDTGNPDGYVEAGRLVMGEYLEPTANMNYGFKTDVVDRSVVTRTRGGVWRSDTRVPYRKVSASFSWLTTSEASDLIRAKMLRGRRYDVLFCGYPLESSVRERDNTVLGVMAEWSANTHDSLNYNSVSFSVEESI